MNSELIIFSVVLPLVALTIAFVCQCAGTGRITRNHGVGLRLPSILASDESWAAGHRAVTPLAWFAFFALAAVAVLAGVIGTVVTVGAGVGVMIALLVIELVFLVLIARRAARRAGRP